MKRLLVHVACIASVVSAALLPGPTNSALTHAQTGAARQTSPTQTKVFRVAARSAERGFDCAAESDELTGTLCDAIFESLLQYDHLARPIQLQPRTAVALPDIAKDGLTYTLRLKPGIYFTDHPAFKGRKRELTAADYVYSFKRLLDPQLKAQWQFLLDGKVVGLNEAAELAKTTGKFDYDRPIAGLSAPDRYTFVIRLTAPDFNLPYILTMPATAAVAREVVEYYPRDAFSQHPIGSGPFKLGDWRRSSKVTLVRNRDYREDFFETAGGTAADSETDQQIKKHLAGKRLPLVDQIEISIIDEDQPRWLAFLNGEHDLIRPIPEVFTNAALPGGRLAPHLQKKGYHTSLNEIAWMTYTTFNMNDPIIGGYSADRIALRRAMSIAYPVDEEISILEKNQAQKIHSPIAPGMAGFTDERAPWHEYNPAKAKALLDTYGYVDRDGDGYREMPDGSPLVIDQASVPRLQDRQRNELWKRAMDAIGIRMTFNKVEKLPDLRKQAQAGKVAMFSYGWIADYPDGENFLQLFWSKSIGGANYTMFSHPEYDALYERVKTMPDSPERTELYRKMVHLLWIYNPWRVNFMRQGTNLMQPWLIGYKKHPFAHEPLRFVDIDLAALAKQSSR